jgi:hypothetical protein
MNMKKTLTLFALVIAIAANVHGEDRIRETVVTLTDGTGSVQIAEAHVGLDRIGELIGALVWMDAATSSNVAVQVATGFMVSTNYVVITNDLTPVVMGGAAGASWAPSNPVAVSVGETLIYSCGDTNRSGYARFWTK